MSGRGGAKRKRLTKGQKEYLAKLRDPRWQKYRLEVFERDGWQCTWCRAGEQGGRNLQVHHGFYNRELEFPWEYPKEATFTLCERCHPQAEIIKQQVYEALGRLHPRYHHHVHADIVGAIQAMEQGKEFDELTVPWAV